MAEYQRPEISLVEENRAKIAWDYLDSEDSFKSGKISPTTEAVFRSPAEGRA